MALRECRFCHGPLRRVKSDGSAVYMNGDRTTTPVEGHSRCGCGFKHYWNGREYDNMPERSDLHVMIHIYVHVAAIKPGIKGGGVSKIFQPEVATMFGVGESMEHVTKMLQFGNWNLHVI